MRVFKSTELYKNSSTYFRSNEYLLGDAAYTNSEITVSPYKAPATNFRDNSNFNYFHSTVRMDIEHSFGIIKKRFPSLNNLRLTISTETAYEYALKWITCCFILHNFLIMEKDECNEDSDDDEEAENNLQTNAPSNDHHLNRDTSMPLREYIKNRVLTYMS